jgi:hypothetical protein
MHKAVQFFRDHCSAGGGYVFQVSTDLKQWEGEDKVTPTRAWIQPPGTPAVGTAYLEAWQLTGDPLLKDAALATADSLIRGQLVSGGWDNFMEFDPELRKKIPYRVDAADPKAKRSGRTTFDDNKSQSAARFLMRLDQALEFKDQRIHEAATFALDSFVKAQYANGAWPQGYTEFPDSAAHPPKQASFPATWSRTFPNIKYVEYYTLNDNTLRDLIALMLDAGDVYHDSRYTNAARRGGDFLLLAQLPDPQPGWAQQYDQDMHPAWARKFEPPAITGGESQSVIEVLMTLYRRTGDAKYLEPLSRALAYYAKLPLPDGEYARFYEIGTNKPLYFTKDYQLTYSDADMPTHYAFKVGSKFGRLAEELPKLKATPRDQLWKAPSLKQPKMSSSLAKSAQQAIAAMDDRGAWVEDGWIESRTFIKNLSTLAQYVAASSPK